MYLDIRWLTDEEDDKVKVAVFEVGKEEALTPFFDTRAALAAHLDGKTVAGVKFNLDSAMYFLERGAVNFLDTLDVTTTKEIPAESSDVEEKEKPKKPKKEKK